MTIHEYGIDKEKVMILVHPSVVMWDYFEYVIPQLAENYHLIIPALPGYDEENPSEDFTSVEEIADITISADNLFSLVNLKMLSDALIQRINGNYRFIISFNMLLIALGISGIIPPALSALLHNASTIAISLKSMTNLLSE